MMCCVSNRRDAGVSALVMSCAGVRCAATPEDCQGMRKHGQRTEANNCFESLGRSSMAYLRAEGYWGLQQYTRRMSSFGLRWRSRMLGDVSRALGDAAA